ncbi:hypothetical protein B0J12DRAFT_735806 [Macrophomina phaseolina]|uniref:Uncharacterized protein n=1 Tax=Macrophomina phaseolina TaxID=35725 RepID=A0ABQ8GPX5_9PEZI|nr:hypothetical protein B0J12DRAFT_735806 [Macrophomina phaseolina]
MLCTSVKWWLALLLPITIAQEKALPGPQCEGFASSYKLSAEQISTADTSDIIAKNVEIALNFERSNWATDSITIDHVYRIPRNWSSDIPAGTLLSVENVTNSSLYTLPPAVSLSRITYQTTTLNDTNIPASAYILWP